MTNSFIVNEQNANKRLDVFLSEVLPEISRSHIKTLVEEQKILLNGKSKKCGEKLKVGDEVFVEIPEPKCLETVAQDLPIEIVYQDNDVAVVNKPQGMVVHPANGNDDGTLVNALLYHLDNLSSINGVIRPGIVHRLDKDTSGLLLIAKNDTSHKNLASQIQSKTCKRHYLALVQGNFTNDSGQIQTYIGRNPKDRKQMAVVDAEKGKLAITNYFVRKRYKGYCLVEFVLQTGRTHQIRVHSKHLGHTIVGDEVYGHKDKNFKTNGQLLHAYKIEFSQPTTNERILLECPLPDYFEKALKKLESVNL